MQFTYSGTNVIRGATHIEDYASA